MFNVKFDNDAKEKESSYEAKIDESFGSYPFHGNLMINSMGANPEEAKNQLIAGLEELKNSIEATIECMKSLSGFSYGIHVIYNLDTGETLKFQHGFYREEMFEYYHVTVGNPDRILKAHIKGDSSFNVMPTIHRIVNNFKPKPTVFGYYDAKTGKLSHRSDGSTEPLPIGSPMIEL